MPVSLESRRLFEDVLGCKWTLGILGALAEGVVRPGRLRRALPGLSPKVMQQRLAKLERFGLATRRVVAEKPLHVEYRLTRKGRELVRIVAGVRRFAERWEVAGDAPAKPTQSR
uniref:Transcriptional regulator n=1 Tax=Eiseniibacteriota bacterium TaxID=2212470 RepID=A0A832MJ40_UNCEI